MKLPLVDASVTVIAMAVSAWVPRLSSTVLLSVALVLTVASAYKHQKLSNLLLQAIKHSSSSSQT